MRLEVQLGVNTSLTPAQCDAVAELVRAVQAENWPEVEAAVARLATADRPSRRSRRPEPSSRG